MSAAVTFRDVLCAVGFWISPSALIIGVGLGWWLRDRDVQEVGR
jgi:hypothetical protein